VADICGLYINGDALSMLSLRQTKKGWSISAGGVEPYAACETDDLGPFIKTLGKSLKIGKNHTALVLPKQQAILRNLQLPSTDREELAQMARFEAERHIPFHAERHSVGFHVMRSMGVEGSEVVLGAVDGPVVERALNGAVVAGLLPRGVELSSVALVNSLLFAQKEWVKSRTIALLAIGLDTLDLVLLTDGRLIFARSITLNLRGVLEACLGFHVTTQDGAVARPEMAKLAVAARMIDCLNLEGSTAHGGSGFSRESMALAQEWSERLVQELRRTYDFARREMKCPPIDAIALTGEGAILHNLGQLLQTNLNMEVQLVNPVGALPGAAELKFPFAGLEHVIAFGGVLAIEQNLGVGLYRLDLTPMEFYRQLLRKRTIRRLIGTALLLVLAPIPTPPWWC
jgi:type IV pilus assembly protein PilM